MTNKPKEVEITVGPDGKVTVDAVGFEGKGCAEATRPYEEALGAVTSDTHKPEMNKATNKATDNVTRRV